MKTIYSIRTDMGRELYWTTGRKAAIELAADFTRWGSVDRKHGGDGKPFAEHDLPLAVYKSTRMATPARSLNRTEN